ncbi:hypothetical protein CRUP_032480, partial [Coryphaenoides rupestris]
ESSSSSAPGTPLESSRRNRPQYPTEFVNDTVVFSEFTPAVVRAQLVLGGPRWSLLVLGGSRWSPVVLGGLSWSSVVLGGLCWSSVVSAGPRWSSVVSVGPRWSLLVLGGLSWSSVVLGGLSWSSVVLGGLRWSVVGGLAARASTCSVSARLAATVRSCRRALLQLVANTRVTSSPRHQRTHL